MVSKRPQASELQTWSGAKSGVFFLPENDSEARVLVWSHLELQRLKKLGMPYRYSRHCVMRREATTMSPRQLDVVPVNVVDVAVASAVTPRDRQGNKAGQSSNSLAPFYTQAKPTCGYVFSWKTDNKKRRMGIPPTNVVRWRSAVTDNSRR